jgi:hypothetical protein
MDKPVIMKWMIVLAALVTMSFIYKLSGNYVLTITSSRDSCYALKHSAYRVMEIIENTLTDTVVLGGGIVFPGYTGEFKYIMVGTKREAAWDPNSGLFRWAKTEHICFYQLRNRVTKGKLVIKYSY